MTWCVGTYLALTGEAQAYNGALRPIFFFAYFSFFGRLPHQTRTFFPAVNDTHLA